MNFFFFLPVFLNNLNLRTKDRKKGGWKDKKEASFQLLTAEYNCCHEKTAHEASAKWDGHNGKDISTSSNSYMLYMLHHSTMSKESVTVQNRNPNRPPQLVFQILGAPIPAGKRGRDAPSFSYILCLLLSFCCLSTPLGFCCRSLLLSPVPCSCQLVHQPVMGPSPYPFHLHLKGTSISLQ